MIWEISGKSWKNEKHYRLPQIRAWLRENIFWHSLLFLWGIDYSRQKWRSTALPVSRITNVCLLWERNIFIHIPNFPKLSKKLGRTLIQHHCRKCQLFVTPVLVQNKNDSFGAEFRLKCSQFLPKSDCNCERSLQVPIPETIGSWRHRL